MILSRWSACGSPSLLGRKIDFGNQTTTRRWQVSDWTYTHEEFLMRAAWLPRTVSHTWAPLLAREALSGVGQPRGAPSHPHNYLSCQFLEKTFLVCLLPFFFHTHSWSESTFYLKQDQLVVFPSSPEFTLWRGTRRMECGAYCPAELGTAAVGSHFSAKCPLYTLLGHAGEVQRVGASSFAHSWSWTAWIQTLCLRICLQLAN